MQVRQRNPNVPLQHPWVAHLNPPPEELAAAAAAGGGGSGGDDGYALDRAPSGGSDLAPAGGDDSRPGSALGDAAAPAAATAAAAAAATAPKLPNVAALLKAQAGLRGAGLANPLALAAAQAAARGAKPLGGASRGGALTGLPLLGAQGLVDQHKLQLAVLQASVAAAAGGVLPVVAPPLPAATQAALTQQLQQQLQAVAARQKQQQQAAAAAARAAPALAPEPAPAAPAPADAAADEDAGGKQYLGVAFVPSAPPKRRFRAAYAPPGGAVVWKKSFERNRQAAIVWDCVALAVEGPGAAINFSAKNYSPDEVRTAAALVWKQSPGVAMAHPACAGLAPPPAVKAEPEAAA
jgi:hypothetical protein